MTTGGFAAEAFPRLFVLYEPGGNRGRVCISSVPSACHSWLGHGDVWVGAVGGSSGYAANVLKQEQEEITEVLGAASAGAVVSTTPPRVST
eukprot:COSAG01_NODE_2000_length_8686_cov_3.000116_4_plen_91_part_00